jgi:hypothetical protein
VEWTEYFSANPDSQAARPQPHSLRRAITFKDRVAASTVASLLLANLVVLGFVSHVL